MRESNGADHKAEVWRQLETVTDPELDEPVTALEFVTRADVDADNCVHIEFRLPTYWCAANFSFLMADDMRNAVRELPWSPRSALCLASTCMPTQSMPDSRAD